MTNVVIEALQDKKRALEQQLEQVKQAIRVQQVDLQPAEAAQAPSKKRKKKRTMSEENKQAARERMQRMWAAKKAAKAGAKRPTSTATKKAGTGKLSAKTGPAQTDQTELAG